MTGTTIQDIITGQAPEQIIIISAREVIITGTGQISIVTYQPVIAGSTV